MGAMASRIFSLTIVYSTVYSGTDQRKHQSSASLAFVRGIHRWPVNSQHKGPVMRKKFPFDDIIMHLLVTSDSHHKGLVTLSFDPFFLFHFEQTLDKQWCCLLHWFAREVRIKNNSKMSVHNKAWQCWNRVLGPDSIKRYHLANIGNPIVKIKRSYDRLTSTMGFPILVRWRLYI